MGLVLKGGRKEGKKEGWMETKVALLGGINIPLSPRNGRFQILRACSIKWNRYRQRHVVSLACKKKITGQGHHSMVFNRHVDGMYNVGVRFLNVQVESISMLSSVLQSPRTSITTTSPSWPSQSRRLATPVAPAHRQTQTPRPCRNSPQ